MPTDRLSPRRRARAIAPGAIAAALVLTATGCGSPGTSSSQAAAAGASPTHRPMAESARFGPDCGMIPATGMGSFHGMAMDPVITAASHNPLLTTFAADVKTAGLTSDFDSMHSVTVFVPANSAFKKLSGSEMSMLHGTAELAKILKYHVVSGRVTPAELAGGKTLTTLEGDTLKASKMGSVYEVNNAHVICGNVRTANATVYVIDKVLTPMH